MDYDVFGSPMDGGMAPASPMLLQTPGAATDAFSFGPPQQQRHLLRDDVAGGAVPMEQSPLVFQRTPQSPAGLRVESWMSSTGKYRARSDLRTPPTAIMASAAKSDLDSALDSAGRDDSPASARLMQRWLGATDSAHFTPPRSGSARRDQGAAPRGAAPAAGADAGGTPMSLLGRPRSLHSRPLRDLEGSDVEDDGSEGGGGGSSDGEAAARHARSPSLGSPGFAATPAARGAAAAGGGGGGAAHAASPMEKMIDLMMAPPSPGLVLRPADAPGASGAPRTPAVKGAAAGAAATPALASSARRRGGGGSARKEPPTPEERVIELMLRGDDGGAADGGGAAAGGALGFGEVRDAEDDGGSSYGGSGGGSESSDEISVDELEALCAEAAAEGAGGAAPDMSPINEIIGLVLATPKERGTTGTRGGGGGGAGGAAAHAAPQEQDHDGAGPRVLFADD
ncbi:MAG: hypothetical protein J3K34DRAFT_476921 [Monoraphidium minutum]|nr:MAG: hypothetical protein J3K34DRAFT_476921 [Monoraphidium minutum]